MSALPRIGVSALLVCACCLAGCASSNDGGGTASTAPASEAASYDQAADAGNAVQDAEASAEQDVTPDSPQREEDNMSTRTASIATVVIDGTPFTMELADNDTAAAFAQMLPLQVEMSELNGNEKYVYFDKSLPARPTNPGTIEAGDVMLYGDNCLVVFYESHPTSYSYTRIGKIVDAPGLAEAVDTGSVSASFSLE